MIVGMGAPVRDYQLVLTTEAMSEKRNDDGGRRAVQGDAHFDRLRAGRGGMQAGRDDTFFEPSRLVPVFLPMSACPLNRELEAKKDREEKTRRWDFFT